MDDKEKKLNELYGRRVLCRKCIYTLSEVDPGDPRRESALTEYNRQLAEIDRKITEIEGKPPPVVIGLKPAALFAKAEGVKQ
jgi:hypothetical protein